MKDVTPPSAPSVNKVYDNQTVIIGTAEAGSIVTITVNSKVIGTATADSKGQFTVKNIQKQKAGNVSKSTILTVLKK